jgi:hypothetical protein
MRGKGAEDDVEEREKYNHPHEQRRERIYLGT